MILILAIHNKETFLNNIFCVAQLGSKFCNILKSPKNCQRVIKYCQSGENFAKYGHTDHDEDFELDRSVIFLKWAIPASFFFIFGLFKQTVKFLVQQM